jgi:hypothetical protein
MKIGTSVLHEAKTQPIIFCIIRLSETATIPENPPLGCMPEAKAVIEMVQPNELETLEKDERILSVGLYPRNWIRSRSKK